MVCPAQLRAATLNSKAQMFTKKIVVENIYVAFACDTPNANTKNLATKNLRPKREETA
jgi:hypothetical protein